VSLETLLGFLVGRRAAIEQVAADPWGVWLGLALVLTAGLARCWDTRDLARQPWHLLLPAAASLVLSTALFLVVYVALAVKAVPPPFGAGYRSLVGLFLLTAPLAWLYGIPFQRLLDARRAVRVRLGVLGLVATWRVALMVRVVSVLLDDHLGAALLLVLLTADLGMLAGLALTARRWREPLTTPTLFAMMGGVQALSAGGKVRERLATLTGCVAVLGVLTLPGWLMGLADRKASADTWQRLLTAPGPGTPPAPGVWLLAGAAALLFAGLMARGQPAQYRRGHVERLMQQGRVAEALRFLSAHGPGDFPPHWSPPPTGAFREPPMLLDVLEAVAETEPPGWVRAAYLGRLREYLADPLWYWPYDADLERLAALLGRMSEGPELARQAREAARRWEEHRKGFPFGTILPEPQPTGRREQAVRALWRLAGEEANGAPAEEADGRRGVSLPGRSG
jgi:hypothetical protein